MKKWIILSILFSMQSEAASVGTYRIYLDSEHRQQKFMVKNNSADHEKCNISFDYMAYEEGGGEVIKLSSEEKVALSTPATKRLRYSPRQFTIKPKSAQYVAFNYKRQINDNPAEYRTYANIKCLKVDPLVKEGLNLTPSIMHSVPLVIRTGKSTDLEANLVFSQIKQLANRVAFRLEHQGNRSVYGDLHLINANGDKLKLLQKNIVIYPEMKYKNFNFSLAGFNSKNMKVVFQETGNYSAIKQFSLPLKGKL
ncbi:hypothetical protein [Paraglaciecola psychrophila]|uniref:Molecular chaperone n=1 Tax=Paraglaciecola psychrophila 170 TaxID=1129794 RepID=K6YZ94_9ALTE|nr:hypothetical protein [Paraglaciecola psychrophila]AGH45409.1 hypothetical protein C427_3300 [Paraglaciecola psychrophila 170]GAC38079.1 hypothetical protein GPSY_2463 [Paraglaciecola psychrophila 170]